MTALKIVVLASKFRWFPHLQICPPTSPIYRRISLSQAWNDQMFLWGGDCLNYSDDRAFRPTYLLKTTPIQGVYNFKEKAPLLKHFSWVMKNGNCKYLVILSTQRNCFLGKIASTALGRNKMCTYSKEHLENPFYHSRNVQSRGTKKGRAFATIHALCCSLSSHAANSRGNQIKSLESSPTYAGIV